MLTVTQRQAIVDELYRLSAEAGPFKPLYWLDGARDGSLNYCGDCVHIALDVELQTIPHSECRDGYVSIGGGYRTDHDNQCWCETCGCRLDGALTYEGAESEFEHFQSVEPGDLSPNAWHDVLCMVEGLSFSPLSDQAHQLARDLIAKRGTASSGPTTPQLLATRLGASC